MSITNSQTAGPAHTTIHLTLQGKGGVGKSLIASILAQYLRQAGHQVHCVDTDPINHTLAQFGEHCPRIPSRCRAPRLCAHGDHGRPGIDGYLERISGVAQSTQERNLVAWINEFFGRVEADGKTFQDMAAFRDSAANVYGAVAILKRNQDTFGRDMEEMISRKLTFDEAIAAPEFHIMAKQRLKLVQRDLFE